MSSEPEAVEALINRGLQAGRLTVEIIAEGSWHLKLSGQQVHELFDRLLEAGIAVDDIELQTAQPAGGPVDAALRDYLDRIGNFPGLPGDKERVLFMRAEAATRAERMRSRSDLDLARLRVLAEGARLIGQDDDLTEQIAVELCVRLIDRGIQARRWLIRSNLSLPARIAGSYAVSGMPVHDLIAEGNLGLVRAVGGFDYRRRPRFSTFAAWWIHQAIRRRLADRHKAIRVPSQMADSINEVLRAEQALMTQLARPPYGDEIGAVLGLSAQAVNDLLETAE